jgi:hypothetical protein
MVGTSLLHFAAFQVKPSLLRGAGGVGLALVTVHLVLLPALAAAVTDLQALQGYRGAVPAKSADNSPGRPCS